MQIANRVCRYWHCAALEGATATGGGPGWFAGTVPADRRCVGFWLGPAEEIIPAHTMGELCLVWSVAPCCCSLCNLTILSVVHTVTSAASKAVPGKARCPPAELCKPCRLPI